jgi:hypothetical protein
MSEPPEPPRVHVTLPGGHRATGRLLRWRQSDDGRWWAEVAVPAPAGAIGQVAGEDYSAVPREPAQPDGQAGLRYVMEVDKRRPNSGATIHDATADCFLLEKPAAWSRLTQLTADQARGQLRIDGTTACTVCNPAP